MVPDSAYALWKAVILLYVKQRKSHYKGRNMDFNSMINSAREHKFNYKDQKQQTATMLFLSHLNQPQKAVPHVSNL